MIPLDDLLNVSSWFGQNAIVYVWQLLLTVPFRLAFVVASKLKLVLDLRFHCSHFEWPDMAMYP